MMDEPSVAIVKGDDPVAVDAVGAVVMGFDPRKAKHLLLAARKGLGVCDLNKIRILGEPVEKVKKNFKQSLSLKLLSKFS